MRTALGIALLLGLLPPLGAQEKAPDEDKVKVSFSGIELEALAQQVERVTKKSFIFQEQLLKGKKVTLQSEKPITPDEFYRVFQSVCLMHSFALVPAPEENINLVKIVPAPQAAKEPGVQPVLTRGQALPSGDGVIYYVVTPKHISAQKTMAVVNTATSPTGVVVQVPNSDLVLVIDAATAVGRAEKLLAILDVPGEPIVVLPVPLSFLAAAQAKAQITEFVLAVDKIATGEQGRSRLEIMTDERLNQIHLIGHAEDVRRAEEYLKTLDRQLPTVQKTIAYYRLKNVGAKDIVDSVRQFLGLPPGAKNPDRKKSASANSPLSGKPSRDLSGAPTLPNSVTPPLRPREEMPEPGTTLPDAAAPGAPPAKPVPSDIEVFALEAQNTLVVIANQAAHEEVKRILENLDRRRPQVLIEVAILQVTGDDSLDMSVDVLFKNGPGTSQGGIGSGGATQADPKGTGFPTQQTASSFTGGAFRYLRADEISTLIKLVATQSRVNILSQPLLLVNDTEDANFTTKVSEPTTVTSQGTSTTQTSFAGFADATTSLTITPQVSPDGYINLKITQSFEEFSGQGSGNGVPPPKVSNNVTTMITVPDRHTAILGGFTRDSSTDTRTGIPILMDIPLIGWLTGSRSTQLTKSRLYLFVRPRVLSTEGFEDLKAASLEKARSAQPLIEDPRMQAEVRGALLPKDSGIREAPLPFGEKK
ncbi:MAG TPA: secretin N-terminal domain-containing protein [Planctomycetota bacterium]|nr:secretin N-terminal domain-containing protein [Planctomycetota bacterium]